MAILHLEVPGNFDFRSPDDWPRWKKRFEQFRLASGLAGEDEERQTSTLLYCLGEEAEDMLGLTNINEGEREQYSKVLEKFNNHFQIRHNLIFERAKFNKRDQREYNDEEVDGTDDEKLLSIRQIESFVKVMKEDKQYKPTMRAEKLRRVKLAIKCFVRENDSQNLYY